jgi:nucleoside-diphosphate-sugar epimerase
MRCLVTGAAGFIGYHLATSLAEDGHDVVVTDNFGRGERDEPFDALATRPNVRLLAGDLTRQSFIETIAGEFDICFHMAAMNGTQNFYQRPWSVVWHSTTPTLNLLEALVLKGRCGKFVYAGSSESYAGTVTRFGWPVPTAEDVPLTILDTHNPRWSYAASKLHGEVATASACRQAASAFLILRYHNIYGPRMGDKHVVPDFFLRALRGEYWIYGPQQTRSFLYVDDAVYASRRLAEMPQAANQVVNVGSGEEITIGDLAGRMMRALGRDNPIEPRPAPAASVARRAPDLTRLHRLVPGYERVPLDEGLTRTLAYYESTAARFVGAGGGFEGILEIGGTSHGKAGLPE